MAPPPKHLITRKLISRFFDKFLPKQPVEAQDFKKQLVNCWKVFGFEDQRCKEIEQLVRAAEKERAAFQDKIKQLNIKQDVLATLNRPVFKQELKGRFNTKQQRPWNIYDGIK